MKKLLLTALAAIVFWPTVVPAQQTDEHFPPRTLTMGKKGLKVKITVLDPEVIKLEAPEIEYLYRTDELFSDREDYRRVSDPDSIVTMLRGRVEFDPPERIADVEYFYVGSFTAVNGRKVSFAYPQPLRAYYPDLNIIDFGYIFDSGTYPTNILDGELLPLPSNTMCSGSGRLMLMRSPYSIHSTEPFLMQWDDRRGKFTLAGTLHKVRNWRTPEAACWKGEVLYLRYASDEFLKLEFSNY